MIPKEVQENIESEAKQYKYFTNHQKIFTKGAEYGYPLRDNEDRWVRVETEPEHEGEYLCGNLVDTVTHGKRFHQFVATYALFRYRTTGELAPEGDIKGCWVRKSGHAVTVTHWQPLPKQPSA